MGFLSSIAGPLIGGAFGLLGDKKAEREVRSGSQAALQAQAPISFSGVGGQALFSGDTLGTSFAGTPSFGTTFNQASQLSQNALGSLLGTSFLGREQDEFNRLQRLRQPSIDAARAGLQERLINRGRSGFARGGGLSGQLFNPESAALEEAILRAQLQDIGAARQFSLGEQEFLLNQGRLAQNMAQSVAGFPLQAAQIANTGRINPGIAALQAAPNQVAARSTSGFFNSLGNTIGGAAGDFFGGGSSGGGLFGGGGAILNTSQTTRPFDLFDSP